MYCILPNCANKNTAGTPRTRSRTRRDSRGLLAIRDASPTLRGRGGRGSSALALPPAPTSALPLTDGRALTGDSAPAQTGTPEESQADRQAAPLEHASAQMLNNMAADSQADRQATPPEHAGAQRESKHAEDNFDPEALAARTEQPIEKDVLSNQLAQHFSEHARQMIRRWQRRCFASSLAPL